MFKKIVLITTRIMSPGCILAKTVMGAWQQEQSDNGVIFFDAPQYHDYEGTCRAEY